MSNFLYSGFSSKDVSGTATTFQDVEIVKRDILNHFFVIPGEVPGRPGFGSIITELMAEPFIEEVENQIEEEVRRVIGSDPRVTIIGYTAEKNRETGHIYIRVELNFVEIGVSDFLDMELTDIGEA